MRKTYVRPRIDKVELILEEAVLTGCKLQVPGPSGPSLDFCGGQGGVWYGMCKEATS